MTCACVVQASRNFRPQADTVGVVERVPQARFVGRMWKARFVGRMWKKVEDLECIQSLFVLNKKFRQLASTPLVYRAIMFVPLYFIGAKGRPVHSQGPLLVLYACRCSFSPYDPPGS